MCARDLLDGETPVPRTLTGRRVTAGYIFFPARRPEAKLTVGKITPKGVGSMLPQRVMRSY